MVILTEEMVMARTRTSDLLALKRFNCWGSELTDVSVLRKMRNVETLSLSINKINTLADFQYCYKLQELFIRRNNVKDLNEICYLQDLPNLRNLWFEENPCTEEEGYRLAVLRVLPNLEKLDDKIVTPEEVQVAMTIGRPLVHPLAIDASPQSEAVSPDSQNGQSQIHSNDDTMHTGSCSDNKTMLATIAVEISQDYDNRSVSSRHNGNYDERRPDTRRMMVHHNVERQDTRQVPNQLRSHRRPVTRNSNILSAVLCLVSELDYPSLEILEMAVRNQILERNIEE